MVSPYLLFKRGSNNISTTKAITTTTITSITTTITSIITKSTITSTKQYQQQQCHQ
jgi:hypothetical protein